MLRYIPTVTIFWAIISYAGTSPASSVIQPVRATWHIRLLLVADETMSDFYGQEDVVIYLMAIVRDAEKIFRLDTKMFSKCYQFAQKLVG